MKKLLYLLFLLGAFTQAEGQNNTVYGAGISYTNGAPSFTPPARTSRVAIDTVTGKWYHYNTPGGWQLLGNTIEEIAGCSTPAYTPTKGDSKVVINNCTSPELYYWTGSAWVWINKGTTYYAGEGIRIQNDSIILDSLYYLQFRTGDTTDLDAGRLSWNAQEGTLDVVINSGNVTGQMFEDVFFNCRNQTGTTITRGTVVMAVGTQGASGRILIAPAIADGSVNSEYILGTAAQDIANGSDGLVYHFGKDRGLNTTGASCGETWADRDVLYCSATTPGCLTKVLPTAPNLKVPVAFVIRAGNNGTLFIRPSHFPSLNQINDVQLTSPTTGQTLTYNASTGVWSNQTPADPSPTNELQTLSTGINTLTLSNGGGTVTVDTDPANDVTGSGTITTIPVFSATQSVSDSRITDNGSIMTFGGSTTSDGSVQYRFVGTNLNCRAGFYTTGKRGIFMGAATNLPQVYGYDYDAGNPLPLSLNGLGSGVAIGYSASSIPGRLVVRGLGNTSTTWTAQFHDNAGASFALMIRDDGRVGIGTSGLTTNARLNVRGQNNTSSSWIAQFHNSDGNSNTLVLRNDGAVAIGTATINNSAVLQIESTTKGVLFPRMTTTERNAITTPADGLVIYNTTDNKLQVRAAGVWVDLH